MMSESNRYLLQAPFQKDLILHLIKEELKCHKFFSGLRELGLDDCFYRPDFSSLILSCIGFKDEENETFDFYFGLLDKYSRQLEPTNESAVMHALSIYVQLVAEVKMRQEQN